MKYLSQPKTGRLLDLLIEQISHGKFSTYSTLKILVAYAKISGVERLRSSFKSFREAGGRISVIVGIGQRNTSREAIELLSALADDVCIFHNPASIGRTFHPKVYFLEGTATAWSSVGSSNLTAGGLLTNYEFNEICRYDLTNSDAAAERASLALLFEAFLPTKSKASVVATPEIVDLLHKKGFLPSEAESKNGVIKAALSQKHGGLAEIFGAEKFEEPPSVGKKLGKVAAATAKPLKTGFWKKLSSWDVNPKSSPGQIQIPIQFASYFPVLDDFVVTGAGVSQGDTYFDVLFVNSKGGAIAIQNSRLILYPPAATHKRTNDEYRFTFRHKEGVFDTLEKDDILEFWRSADPKYWFVIKHYKASSAKALSRAKRFDIL